MTLPKKFKIALKRGFVQKYAEYKVCAMLSKKSLIQMNYNFNLSLSSFGQNHTGHVV